MDYEKKYKESLALMVNCIPDEDGYIHVRPQDIFLELKESEDEKIRKAVIEMIHDTPNVEYEKNYNVRKEDVLAWLEKQGEQEVNEPDWCHHKVDLSDCSEEYRKAYYDGWNNCNQQHSQCNAEQKSADKVEPKFKVGDWIIYSNEEVHLITGFDDYGYFVDKECYIPYNCEGNMRLFTIQDAKELKKIEQKPTQETEPFEAEHGKYYYCIKDYFCGGRKQASKGDVVQALRGLPIMGLKDASEYFLPVNFIKCNSAWSEEDEKILKDILVDVKFEGYNNDMLANSYKKINWLKSLKEKFKIQTRQGISKEDEYSFMLISGLIRQDQDLSLKDKNKLRLWLKSIIYQSRWKPSIAQLNALSIVSKGNAPDDIEAIVSLYNDLKKLTE